MLDGKKHAKIVVAAGIWPQKLELPHMIQKMSTAEKPKQEAKKQKQTCFADYVVDVPEIIVNPKKFTNYKRLQFLGSVSFCVRVQRCGVY